MNKCRFCGSKENIVPLEMNRLDQGIGNSPESNFVVCGKCQEMIFEIAKKAIDQYVEDLSRKIDIKSRLLEDLDEYEKEEIDIARVVFESIKKVAEKPENVKRSLSGNLYVWMSDIREHSNQYLSDLNLPALSPQLVSKTIRHTLKLQIGDRQGPGVPVFINQEIIDELDSLFTNDMFT